MEIFLYLMISQTMVDIAQYIWNQMVEFEEHSHLRVNLPFVAMVTTMCAVVGVPFWEDKITKPPVGPFTLASVHKSRSCLVAQQPLPLPLMESPIPRGLLNHNEAFGNQKLRSLWRKIFVASHK